MRVRVRGELCVDRDGRRREGNDEAIADIHIKNNATRKARKAARKDRKINPKKLKEKKEKAIPESQRETKTLEFSKIIR